MDQLKQSLTSLVYVNQRTKKALIAELLPAIDAAHQQGFKLAYIHQEIDEVIPMPYATFASCLHRIRQANKATSQNPEKTAVSPKEDTVFWSNGT